MSRRTSSPAGSPRTGGGDPAAPFGATGRAAFQLCALIGLVLAGSGCQSSPAVGAVWSQQYRERVAPVDQDFFLTDRASRIRTTSAPLPVAEQGEEFRVNWTGRGVTVVQFEYRQVNVPDKLMAQAQPASRRPAATFWIRGEEFQTGGPVSAWRITLWRGAELLAEKHSTLW